jgi:hypothetical protein
MLEELLHRLRERQVFEVLNEARAFRRGRRRGVGGPYRAGDKNRPPAFLRPLGAVSAEMGKAPNLKGVNLEEIKEKLKRALGIKRDETLLYFAMWGASSSSTNRHQSRFPTTKSTG